MANKSIFKSIVGSLLGRTDTINEAGGKAYKFSPEHALAQYAITGCLNATYYANAEEQLNKIQEFCEQVSPEFIAKTAVYCREHGFMKDTPALLCAILAVKDRGLLAQIFNRVIDNGKMLRNFVQILRSGVVGRKSLGTLPKRLILEWLQARSDEALFRDSIGQNPSFADIIKMVHPKPQTKMREAFYAYMIGRDVETQALPELIQQYEAFKNGQSLTVPNVPFQLLTMLPLSKQDWVEIARKAPWQMTRMNLNTFARHGVFQEAGLAELIAERLVDAKAIAKARVLPYQLMTAFTMASDIPQVVREALQDAMELAIANVPEIDGKVIVCPDVSGSMSSPVTGYRQGATSAVRCIDVAALVAASILRKNKTAQVLPFEQQVVSKLQLNARDSVMTNAKQLASIGGGGTNCSAPIKLLNDTSAQGDLVIFVSDNESWVDGRANGRGTALMQEWNKFKQRNTKARLVCIDIQPYGTTQAQEREDILNIGGFSDRVFDVIADFATGKLNNRHWVGVINNVQL